MLPPLPRAQSPPSSPSNAASYSSCSPCFAHPHVSRAATRRGRDRFDLFAVAPATLAARLGLTDLCHEIARTVSHFALGVALGVAVFRNVCFRQLAVGMLRLDRWRREAISPLVGSLTDSIRTSVCISTIGYTAPTEYISRRNLHHVSTALHVVLVCGLCSFFGGVLFLAGLRLRLAVILGLLLFFPKPTQIVDQPAKLGSRSVRRKSVPRRCAGITRGDVSFDERVRVAQKTLEICGMDGAG